MNTKFLKLLCLTMAVLLSAGLFAIPVMAGENIRVVLNDEELSFDTAPQIIEGRTMVPMRAIFEALGADVDWDGDTQTITATQGDIIIIMHIDNVVISVSGEDITLDVPPLLVNDRTLVPVRAVAESLNAYVDWDGETQTVIITSEKPLAATRPARYPEDGALFGFGNDGIAELQYNARYLFEQTMLPRNVFENDAKWIQAITTSNVEKIEGVILDVWEAAAANVILNDLLLSGGERPDDDDFWDFIDEQRPVFGLEDEHIGDITIVTIDAYTNAVIIDMLETGWTLLSTYIGIAYNETMGLRFITLERSLDLFGDGNPPYLLCFITPQGRGSFGIAVANYRGAFVSAVRGVMNVSATSDVNLRATVTVMEVGAAAAADRDKEIMAGVAIYNDSGENVTSQFHFGRVHITRGSQTISYNLNRQSNVQDHVFHFTANWNPGDTVDITVEIRESGESFVEVISRNVRIYDVVGALNNLFPPDIRFHMAE